jgi:hypothetical protein
VSSQSLEDSTHKNGNNSASYYSLLRNLGKTYSSLKFYSSISTNAKKRLTPELTGERKPHNSKSKDDESSFLSSPVE